MPNEDYAIVLDYLPRGKSTGYRAEPLCQILGTEFFTVLEAVPKAELKIGETVYVGKDERPKIGIIKRRISYPELTSTAQIELPKAVENVITDNAAKFLSFFNDSASLSLRMHQLELLPGLGKKHTHAVLEEREKKKFESFDEITKRIHLMPDPVKLLVRRILLEIQGEGGKHYLFARPPAPPEQRNRFGGRS